jgi:hypothetical protein
MASQTPRRGRAVHGLVGPAVFTARTADEMISRAESDDSEITIRQNWKDRDFAKHSATAISSLSGRPRFPSICHSRSKRDDERARKNVRSHESCGEPRIQLLAKAELESPLKQKSAEPEGLVKSFLQSRDGPNTVMELIRPNRRSCWNVSQTVLTQERTGGARH